MQLLRLLWQWVLEIGRDLVVILFRPRVWMLIVVLILLAIVAYVLFDQPAVVLVMRNFAEKTLPRWFSVLKIAIAKLWPKLVALFTRALTRTWVRKVLVLLFGWMVRRPVKRWFAESVVIIGILVKLYAVHYPREWWQRQRTSTKLVIITTSIALVASVIGLHVIGLLFFVPLALVREVLGYLWDVIVRIATRFGAARFIERVQTAVVGWLRAMVPAWMRNLRLCRRCRAWILRQKWRLLRRLVKYRQGLRERAERLVDEQRRRRECADDQSEDMSGKKDADPVH